LEGLLSVWIFFRNPPFENPLLSLLSHQGIRANKRDILEYLHYLRDISDYEGDDIPDLTSETYDIPDLTSETYQTIRETTYLT
jgi:hypothetical protein